MTVYAQGKYLVRTTRIELCQSAKKGTPQIMVAFEPLNRVDDKGEFQPCPEGRGLLFLYLTDKTIDRTAKDIATIGYRGPLEHIDPDNPDYSDQAGLEFEAECLHDSYNNTLREVWRVAGSGGPVNQPLGKTAAAMLFEQFGERFKDGIQEAVRNDAYSQPLPPEQIAAESRGEDIPF